MTQDKDPIQKAIDGLLAKIRMKKGFYSISVGNSETKQAHKAGILKGLDAAENDILEALSALHELKAVDRAEALQIFDAGEKGEERPDGSYFYFTYEDSDKIRKVLNGK